MPRWTEIRSDEAQDLVEYGLLASLVSIAAVGGISLLGIGVADMWRDIVTRLAAIFG